MKNTSTKLIFSILFIISIFSVAAFSQTYDAWTSNYSWSYSTAAIDNLPSTGVTTVVQGRTTPNIDDTTFTLALPSAFVFSFNGTAVTSAYASSNGFITFNTPAVKTDYFPISSSNNYVGAISPMGANLYGYNRTTNAGANWTFSGTILQNSTSLTLPAGSNVRPGCYIYNTTRSWGAYILSISGNTATMSASANEDMQNNTFYCHSAIYTWTTGTSPSRVFHIYFGNWGFNNSGTPNGVNYYEILLTETTNKIDVIYGLSNVTSAFTPQVGLRAGSDWNNITSTTSWSAPVNNISPNGSSSATMTLTSTIKPAEGSKNSFTPTLTSVGNHNQNLKSYKLYGNYPNPFNPVSKIKFEVGGTSASNVFISIYDMTGRQIMVLVNQNLNPGTYEIMWNAENVASGNYICRMTAGSYVSSFKMSLVK